MTRDNRSHGRTGRGGRGCGTMASASALPLMRQAHVARANTPRRRTARRGRPPRAAGQRGRQARALSPPLASHTHTHTHTVPYLVQHREHLAQLLHLPLMLPCRLLRRLLALAPPKRQDDPHRSPRHVPPAYRPRLPPPSPSPPRDVFIVAALWATATTKNKVVQSSCSEGELRTLVRYPCTNINLRCNRLPGTGLGGTGRRATGATERLGRDAQRRGVTGSPHSLVHAGGAEALRRAPAPSRHGAARTPRRSVRRPLRPPPRPAPSAPECCHAACAAPGLGKQDGGV